MGRNLSSFLQWRFNISLYMIFGWKIAKILILFLGRLYFYVNRDEKALIKNSVREVIGYSQQKNNRIRETVKNIFMGILCHYYEKIFIAFEEPQKATKFLLNNIISDDINMLHEKLLKGKGVIIATGHYGAIEYIPTLLAINSFPVSIIAKFKTRQLKKKVFDQAKKYNIKLIDGENKGNVFRSAIRELKENRILVTQCDEIEEWRPSKNEKMSFLGRVTGVDRTINVIQKKTGSEVVFGIIHRYSLNNYRLILHDHEDRRLLDDASTCSVGETVLKFLEQYIYANPEQWYQWKKYSEIRPFPGPDVVCGIPVSVPLLKPAFGGVS